MGNLFSTPREIPAFDSLCTYWYNSPIEMCRLVMDFVGIQPFKTLDPESGIWAWDWEFCVSGGINVLAQRDYLLLYDQRFCPIVKYDLPWYLTRSKDTGEVLDCHDICHIGAWKDGSILVSTRHYPICVVDLIDISYGILKGRIMQTEFTTSGNGLLAYIIDHESFAVYRNGISETITIPEIIRSIAFINDSSIAVDLLGSLWVMDLHGQHRQRITDVQSIIPQNISGDLTYISGNTVTWNGASYCLLHSTYPLCFLCRFKDGLIIGYSHRIYFLDSSLKYTLIYPPPRYETLKEYDMFGNPTYIPVITHDKAGIRRVWTTPDLVVVDDCGKIVVLA